MLEPIKKTIMKKVAIFLGAVAVFGFSACNKCHECHYDGANGEVELGEYCGDEAEDLEASGYADPSTGTVYTVHCGEDH
tara:strand:+ start:863 stop:1099 length:237 start_codon:yes stop_codon:yes gene_type:complete